MRILIVSALVILGVNVHAKAADAPQPVMAIDCDIVRAQVAEHGKARALAWAIENGYSLSQINQARKCLNR